MATTAAAVGMRKRGKLPGWLKGFNQVVMALQRLGLAIGTMHVLSGRIEEHVSLIEVPVEDRAPILREFPRLVPQGVPFFTRLYGVTADPAEFAGLALTCPVFRIERR
jgi:hypothetical protein